MVFYSRFQHIISVISRQLTLFMSFLGFTSNRMGRKSVLPKDTQIKKDTRESGAARPQDSLVTGQTLYHYAIQAPHLLNLFPNKPWFLCVCSTSLLKALREKEKLLVTSNFSFSHSVFYPFTELSAMLIKFKIVVCKPFQFGKVKMSFGKGLKRFFNIILSYQDVKCTFIT